VLSLRVEKMTGQRALCRTRSALRLPAGIPAEAWFTLFVFAGLVKSIGPLSAAIAIPWDLTAVFGMLALFSLHSRICITGKLRRLQITRGDLWLAALTCILAIRVLYTHGSRPAAFGKLVKFSVLGVAASYLFPRLLALSRGSPLQFLLRVYWSLVVTASVLCAYVLTIDAGPVMARSPGGGYLTWGYFLGAATIAGGSLVVYETSTARRLVLLSLLVIP